MKKLLLAVAFSLNSLMVNAQTLQNCYNNAAATGGVLDWSTASYYMPGVLGVVIQHWVLSPPPAHYVNTGSCNISYGNVLPRRPKINAPRAPHLQCGSILHVNDESVGESVRIAGTDDFVNYMSDRTYSRSADYKFTLPLTGSVVESGLVGVKVDVDIAGQSFSTTYSTLTPNMTYAFTWDGKDNSGNWFNHGAKPVIKFHHIYSNPGIPDIPFEYPTFTLGGLRAALFGLGGWTYSSVHYFDTELGKIYFGSGESREASILKVTLSSGQVAIVTGSTFDYYMVVDKESGEAYLFDASGRHAQTRSLRTGSLLKTIAYDGSGRLASITDGYSNTTTFSRPTSTSVEITAPFGQVTTLTLDGAGLLINIEDPMGHDHSVTYNVAGLMETFTNPRSAVNTFTYNADGLLTQDEHSSGARWQLSTTNIDSFATFLSFQTLSSKLGRQTSTYSLSSSANYSRYDARPDGKVADYTYSTAGSYKIESLSPGPKLTEYYTPDPRFGSDGLAVNRRIFGNGPVSLTTTMALSQSTSSSDILNIGSESETTTVNSQDWVRSYNGSTKVETLTSPVGRVKSVTYNGQDRVIQQVPYIYSAINYTYDAAGRLSDVTQSGRTTELSYNASGYISQIENALNQVTSFTYDANGKVLTQTLPDSRVLTYTYDANGNLASVQTAASVTHSLTYNLYDLIMSYVAPVLGLTNYVSTYSYNDDKQLTQIMRPDSTTVDFSYGATTGLLNSITVPEGAYSLSYTSGQLSQISTPGSVTNSFSYNGSLPASVRTAWGSVDANIAYTYSNYLFSTSTITDTSSATSSVSYSYDNDRLLTGVGDLGLTRDANTGQVTGSALGNAEETFAYDATYGELDIYRAKYSGSEIYKEDYGRDALGRITSRAVTLPGPATTTYGYSYDASGRLYQVHVNGTLARTYNYSSNSNRSSLVSGGTTVSATYDAQDRILTYGAHSYTYNARGELSGRTTSSSVEAFTYSYNSLHALTQVVHSWDNSGSTVTDTYDYVNDGRGLRIEVLKNSISQKRYIYDESGRLVAELDGGGDLLSHFVYATRSHVPDYMIKSGVKYLFVHDHVGSVVRVIDSSSGSVASSISYDEFGRITSSSSLDFQPFGFAGGLRDDVTGFVRFGVRDYDPETGRWTSKDPILFKGGDTNLFGYVLADPVNKIDPSGLITICITPYVGFTVCVDGRDPLNPETGQLPPGEPCIGPFCAYWEHNPPMRQPSREPWPQGPPIASMPPSAPSGMPPGGPGPTGGRSPNSCN